MNEDSKIYTATDTLSDMQRADIAKLWAAVHDAGVQLYGTSFTLEELYRLAKELLDKKNTHL